MVNVEKLPIIPKKQPSMPRQRINTEQMIPKKSFTQKFAMPNSNQAVTNPMVVALLELLELLALLVAPLQAPLVSALEAATLEVATQVQAYPAQAVKVVFPVQVEDLANQLAKIQSLNPIPPLHPIQPIPLTPLQLTPLQLAPLQLAPLQLLLSLLLEFSLLQSFP
jgi:hypothetical protein